MKVVPQWIHRDTTTEFAQSRPLHKPPAQGGSILQPKFPFSEGLPYAPQYSAEAFSNANTHGQSTAPLGSSAAALELARQMQVPSRKNGALKAALANSVFPKDQDTYGALIDFFGTGAASMLHRTGGDPVKVKLPDTALGA